MQEATQKFAEVQAAYEVLSDPQERAWYDSHRDAILAGQDANGEGVDVTTFRNIRLTSAEELMSLIRKFNTSISFDDEPTGFFGISRETFEHLAMEEEAAAEFDTTNPPEYPTFGSSDDEYETVVKLFYTHWAGFSTRKTFSWKDKYRLSDAPDRRVRRLMEKENKKIREDSIREFNDAVRFLVNFVRKRDPRYLPNSQTEADRQKNLRDAAAAQAARSRAANLQKLETYEAPGWSKPRNVDAADSLFSESDDASEVEVLECVVCSKIFKSANQLEAHERSKKHIRALQQLRRRLQKEGNELELEPLPDQSTRFAEVNTTSHEHGLVEENSSGDHSDSSEGKSPAENGEAQWHSNDTPQRSGESTNDGSDGDYAPRSVVELRLGPDPISTPIGNLSASPDQELSEATNGLSLNREPAQHKVGKAKAKRQKKAARQLAEGNTHVSAQETCGNTICFRSNLPD